jgi:anti-anti-sigma factor
MAGEAAGPPVVIVPLPSEIDVNNSADAWAGLLDTLDGPGVVIADMTGTTFCDSSGVRMLVTARDRAAASGSTLRIVVSPDGPVARVLSIVGLDGLLPIYGSVREAMPDDLDAS